MVVLRPFVKLNQDQFMSNAHVSPVTEELGILPNPKICHTQSENSLAGQAIFTLNEGQLRPYRVEVRNQGRLVAEHIIAASDALKAINLIESEYGEPLQAEIVKVETAAGRQRQVLAPKHWHGYTFDARVIEG
jgi:hypothetical protein